MLHPDGKSAVIFTGAERGAATDGILMHCAFRLLGQLALCQLLFAVIFTSAERGTGEGPIVPMPALGLEPALVHPAVPEPLESPLLLPPAPLENW